MSAHNLAAKHEETIREMNRAAKVAMRAGEKDQFIELKGKIAAEIEWFAEGQKAAAEADQNAAAAEARAEKEAHAVSAKTLIEKLEVRAAAIVAAEDQTRVDKRLWRQDLAELSLHLRAFTEADETSGIRVSFEQALADRDASLDARPEGRPTYRGMAYRADQIPEPAAVARQRLGSLSNLVRMAVAKASKQ
jgi:hypothetical protein